jgi:hypothetical protein
LHEAEGASDATLKTSLLLRAASILWQYKKKGKNKDVDRLFKGAQFEKRIEQLTTRPREEATA